MFSVPANLIQEHNECYHMECTRSKRREAHDWMFIAAMTFRLHAPWVRSLKEKRMIVKSLVAQLQNRFHVSAAEIDEQDVHQIIVIGVAAVVPHNALADSLMDEITQFMETATDAQLLEETREIR